MNSTQNHINHFIITFFKKTFLFLIFLLFSAFDCQGFNKTINLQTIQINQNTYNDIMKKNYILLLLGVSTLASSQTFTYAGFANSLTATLNVKVANTSSFNTAIASITGTGVTWNAAGLTQQSGTPNVQFIYGSPASTPNGSLFPNSTHAFYDPALIAVIKYDYYSVSTTSYENWGEYSPSTAHEIFQNSDKRLQFPFSYGQSFSDTYAKTNYSNATTVSSTQTGNRTVNFSGYGTLILPQGSFTNVGLISELRTNSLGPNSTAYTWWDISTGKRLLAYSENNGSVSVVYNADAPLSVSEMEAANVIRLFPNPSNGNFTIEAINGVAIQSVTVCNALGQIIYRNATSNNHNTIALEGLSTGICFVTVTTTDGSYVKKIMIE